MIEWKGTQMAKGRVNDDRGGGRQWKEDLKRIPNLMVGGGWLSKSTAQRPAEGGWVRHFGPRNMPKGNCGCRRKRQSTRIVWWWLGTRRFPF